MDLFVGTLVFIYGMILGSFFNNLALRWVEDKTITGRSICPHCGATLHAKNLVPVLSFLFQGGKCHNCKAKIGWIYPTMELLTAVTYLIVYLVYGLSINFAIGIIFMTVLLISAVTDFTEGLVLDKIVIPPTIVILILTVVFERTSIVTHLVPAIIIFLLLLIAVKMEKLGSGDVTIIAGTYLVQGFLFGSFAMLFSSTITLAYMLITKKKKVPFIPFWVIGNILTYVIIYFVNNASIGLLIP